MDTPAEDFDVLIIGAGLSGIGAACHLRRAFPEKRIAVLEGRAALGGTWDLFRYPGIRSDSDMFTLGYDFRPWREARAIADGPAILRYIRDTAAEYGVDRLIRYQHQALRASWCSREARWTVEVRQLQGGATATFTCRFLLGCTGYYRYDQGYAPAFPGEARFPGPIVHPQHWPAELPVAGRRVVVIGSGATAVTLVPALAEQGAEVVMLQRSPSYVMSLPAVDAIADAARRHLPAGAAYQLVRWKNVLLSTAIYQLSRRAPRLVRRLLRRGVMDQVPPGFDVDRHFNPRYEPWDQRLCLAPDGDFFRALRGGRASVVTGAIRGFTEAGVELEDGALVAADIIVKATGLQLLALGGMTLRVDGAEVPLAETVGYKGAMLSGVPNLALTLGYTNASWTLKADLVAHYVCRLLRHMDRRGYRSCRPRAPDASEPLAPFLDLKAGYVQRALATLPRQGSRAPWRLYQNYLLDRWLFRRSPLEDGALEFAR